MSKNFKKSIAFFFFLLAGIILGAFISYICAGNRYLSWLAWGKAVGVPTTSVDLIVFKLSFGLMLDVTIAQIFTVIAALIIFSKTCKSL